MRIAVTFFNSKKQKKNNKYKLGNMDFIVLQDKVSVINFQLLILIIVCTYMLLKYNFMLLFGTNITSIDENIFSARTLLALNNITNIKSYNYSQIIKEEKKEENIPDEYLAMDEIAKQFSEQAVFSKFDSYDINILAETESYQKINVCGIEIKNYSSNRNIDFGEILKEEDILFDKKQDDVLLYTTHTSESYANGDGYEFGYTSAARSVDGNYNMLGISSTFADNLNNKGINTVCSLTPHDYGEYNSAYMNSRNTLFSLISANPKAKIAIDVHRDAIADLSFAPKIEIKGYNVANLMLVMGIGYPESENIYYKENLKLALQIQLLANKIYPGLFRTMIIRDSVYNQDMMKNSFLVEVGATGNTIKEAKIATRCLANLINILYKD